jgi:hypothetical protein
MERVKTRAEAAKQAGIPLTPAKKVKVHQLNVLQTPITNYLHDYSLKRWPRQTSWVK